ncbi:hypothetical protein NQZ68_007104 [Dissostichus eleginoides]|nr:hypothetical protein NQZ68_007104 [Dissostichus eleginoides]
MWSSITELTCPVHLLLAHEKLSRKLSCSYISELEYYSFHKPLRRVEKLWGSLMWSPLWTPLWTPLWPPVEPSVEPSVDPSVDPSVAPCGALCGPLCGPLSGPSVPSVDPSVDPSEAPALLTPPYVEASFIRTHTL